MKKKNIILSAALALTMIVMPVTQVSAQRHLYNRIEFGSGNAYSYIGMIAASMAINHFAHSPLSEATLRVGIPSSEYGNLNSYQGFTDWNSDRFCDDPDYGSDADGVAKFNGRNLFSNIIVGDKIGYLSDKQGSVNYCVYGAAYYNLNQFKRMYDYEDYNSLCTQRLQLGGGLMLIFGSIEKKGRFIIDGGLRYNIPLYFSVNGEKFTTNDYMASGISSHYMVKYSYGNAVAVGLTFDMMHYNLFKNEIICGNKSKIMEFGINLSILYDSLLN